MSEGRRLRLLLGKIFGLRDLINRAPPIDVDDKPQAIEDDARISRVFGPICLDLGTIGFAIYPDQPILESSRERRRDWIIAPMAQIRRGIFSFARLREGDTIGVGYDDRSFRKLFGLPKGFTESHIAIINDHGDLVLSVVDADQEAVLTRLDDARLRQLFGEKRKSKLDRLTEMIGDLTLETEHQTAITLARDARMLFASSINRPLDFAGKPGGLLRLPDELSPIILGDLHGEVDNLLKTLCENRFLEGLELGTAYLLLLGDVIHSEDDDGLDNMDSSILMLDLIFKLKRAFPNNVYMLRGNHESFDPGIVKGGIPQAALFKKILRERRGDDYVSEIDLFFDSLPYVAYSNAFAATHAAPTRGQVTPQMLADLSKYPGLSYELTWNRLRAPGYPTGYTKSDVRRFRKSLDLEKSTPFIVGHTPQSKDAGYWVRAGNIKQHYVVYSARPEIFGVMTKVGESIVALDYHGEPLITQENASTGRTLWRKDTN